MSEYQYYEFLALDRRLTRNEMQELRDASSRARITPTSFVNDYQWGGFKGNVDTWMAKYFDVFLYFANWGTHIFKVRLPLRVLPLKAARQYCRGESLLAHEVGQSVVLTFDSELDGGDEDLDESGVLSGILPVREELARGDLRSLYLGWLGSAQSDCLDESEREPPVPAGLADLSPALANLVDFLRIDEDLLAVAAAGNSASSPLAADPEAFRAWISGLSTAEKDDVLCRLVIGDEPTLARELLQRFRRTARDGRRTVDRRARRTVAALLRAADRVRDERERRAEMERVEAEARHQREAAAERAAYLDALSDRRSAVWREIQRLIAARQPHSYDTAVKLLIDLKELEARKPSGEFMRRLDILRAEHATKPAFCRRLAKAGL